VGEGRDRRDVTAGPQPGDCASFGSSSAAIQRGDVVGVGGCAFTGAAAPFVLLNHPKSQSFAGGNPDPLRRLQAERVRKIYDDLRAGGSGRPTAHERSAQPHGAS
jgi:hypothetical protein